MTLTASAVAARSDFLPVQRTLQTMARDPAPLYDRPLVMVALIVALAIAVGVIVVLLVRVRRLGSDREATAAAGEPPAAPAAPATALEQAKSDFLATASHELRSPLTSLKGFVELLQNGTRDGQFSEREREFVDIIRRSTDRLVELVDELLDVAQIDAEHVELDLRPVDAGEAIHELAELMGPRVAAKDQHLGVYVAPTLPPAFADARRIRQIIGNLLTNAHLYTPEGGRIHIGAEAERAWVRIVVADSGVGMTEAETARIFERFYRVRNGATTASGTGLGLSIVRSLVELHGGRIAVASRPEHGTIFEVRIPAAAREAVSAADVLGGRRVLVVAGEPETGRLIADRLSALEIETEVAGDGQRALAALAEQSFDAVTLDVGVPGSEALGVVAQMRADRELRTIPIVFVTAREDRPDLAGEWTVAKPVQTGQLHAVLAAAVAAARSRVLVVGREAVQPLLEPALDDMGIEYAWETTGAAAARACEARRFEVALIDAGLRNPEAVVEALARRRRRLQRAVILFSEEQTAPPPSLARLGMEVVPVQDAPEAVLGALRGDRRDADKVPGGANRQG